MRKNTFFGSVALGIAGLALAAPLANATGDGVIRVEPGAADRGQQVTVSANCNWPGGASAKLDSKVLEPATLNHKGDGILTGVAKVKADAQPGSWPVSFKCGDVTVRGSFVVKAVQASKHKPAPAAAKDSGQVAVKPKGAADTGEGDVAAAPAQESGSNTGLYVLGGAGVLAAGGAGVFMLRRRSRA
ncbi:hypothetical protein [Kibdelosporangium phytohabitans]|uniref:Gram-positive cocci surface proteins LPxTG domain-containing protein n=1 Tax=Kibdelosporangium phytohabitans TaxID=860235 RepID=A0A0N9I6C3_9PSEU|nr:hypothetical protein [Kibdelosporangium phytohabitans]ALG13667.1 hypothetical protein AOZ06_48500 [Kibdelosporangium phytohabitans]MBE1465553.1 hypothetical protein [Kibdelosporangium phytohabitans]